MFASGTNFRSVEQRRIVYVVLRGRRQWRPVGGLVSNNTVAKFPNRHMAANNFTTNSAANTLPHLNPNPTQGTGAPGIKKRGGPGLPPQASDPMTSPPHQWEIPVWAFTWPRESLGEDRGRKVRAGSDARKATKNGISMMVNSLYCMHPSRRRSTVYEAARLDQPPPSLCRASYGHRTSARHVSQSSHASRPSLSSLGKGRNFIFGIQHGS